ncbi:hypothetical protein DFJ74DRAFT_654318 [Hyaloraphidium curvatum]|nr:hypothetical protein DFJ74DRAFT_654318 [Hyaloraphidium curvatum]
MGNDTGNKKAASVDAAAPAPHEPWKVRVKRWVRNPLLQLVLLATVLLVFVTVSVVTYRTTASDEYTSVESYLPDTPDRIRLTLRMIGADLVNHRILMSVRTFPEGRFRAEQNTPSQNISVEMDNILRKWWWLVGMPIPILPYDTAVNVAGDVNMFPFDVSSATFTVRAYGFNDPSLVIPVGIQFINNVATLSVTTSVLPVPGAGDLSVSTTISISRLTTVKVYAMFTCIISWVLALAVTLLFIDSAWSKHRVEAPILALAIALVFALPALRNSNPGIPPIGTVGCSGAARDSWD